MNCIATRTHFDMALSSTALLEQLRVQTLERVNSTKSSFSKLTFYDILNMYIRFNLYSQVFIVVREFDDP
jgi:hypothetical protein